MQNPNEFQPLSKAQLQSLRHYSIEQLEKLRTFIENKQKVIRESIKKMEDDAKTSMSYPSLEFTRCALLTFWGKRSETEKQLQILRTLGEKLDLKLVNNIEDLPEKTRKSIEDNFKVGETYSNLSHELASLEHLIVIVQGVISEKKINELQMEDMDKVLKDLLSNDQQSLNQEQVDANASDLSGLAKVHSM